MASRGGGRKRIKNAQVRGGNLKIEIPRPDRYSEFRGVKRVAPLDKRSSYGEQYSVGG
jgi:hypothetical protein